MRFPEFQRAAEEAYARIPDEYKEGIDGLRVSPEAEPHPSSPQVYTLGECVTESYPSDWEGPDTTRSFVVLYHGSFKKLAERDPDLDWEDELWETLTHELRHHLEWLAQEDDLEGVDYAMDQEFYRFEGEPFDPWYFQQGDHLGDGLYRVERSYYLERRWAEPEEVLRDPMEVEWRGRRYRFAPPLDPHSVPSGEAAIEPESLPDIHFIHLAGVAVEEEGQFLELVLLRKLGWWETLKRLVTRTRPTIAESSVEVVDVGPVDPAPE